MEKYVCCIPTTEWQKGRPNEEQIFVWIGYKLERVKGIIYVTTAGHRPLKRFAKIQGLWENDSLWSKLTFCPKCSSIEWLMYTYAQNQWHEKVFWERFLFISFFQQRGDPDRIDSIKKWIKIRRNLYPN